jgi:hypothetical protein
MTPQSVIAGHVTDSAGEPLNGSFVNVISASSRRQIAGTTTNDLGEFRVANLEPGSYYVRAAAHDEGVDGTSIQTADAPSMGAADKPAQTKAPTLYPNAPDLESASPLRLQAGVEQAGIDIQLRQSPAFRIRGEVFDDMTGRRASRATVGLTPEGNGGLLAASGLAGPDLPNGQFEISGVLPGTYHLIASIRSGSVRYVRQSITVGDKHLDGIVLNIPSVVRVSGHVRAVGRDAAQNGGIDLKGLRDAMAPARSFGIGSLPEAQPRGVDGAFAMESVVPENYEISLSGLPRGYYLKSVETGHRDAGGRSVTVTGNTELDLILSPGAGQVSGTIVDDAGNATPNSTVLASPANRTIDPRCYDCYSGVADGGGQFQLPDMIPGTYRVFGLDECAASGMADGDAALSTAPEGAKSLAVEEGSKITVEVQVAAIR